MIWTNNQNDNNTLDLDILLKSTKYIQFQYIKNSYKITIDKTSRFIEIKLYSFTLLSKYLVPFFITIQEIESFIENVINKYIQEVA